MDTLRRHEVFEKDYEIVDAPMKRYTILFELRSAAYPRRLKIEVRRKWTECASQQMIAFSRFSTKQVLLRVHTLDQTMKNKMAAFLDRGEIRDCFDIEFMLRRGVALSFTDEKQSRAFQKKLGLLKTRDFKIKLGSILEGDIRDYYVENRFSYLEEKLDSLLSKP